MKNGYIENCQNNTLQVIAGIFIGILISALTWVLAHFSGGKMIHKIWIEMIVYLRKRIDKKANKRAKIIEMSTIIPAVHIYEDNYLTKNHKKAYKNRSENKSLIDENCGLKNRGLTIDKKNDNNESNNENANNGYFMVSENKNYNALNTDVDEITVVNEDELVHLLEGPK